MSSIKSQQPSGNGRRRSSPLVRRIANDHNVDIGQIAGSGIGGRVTKDDILGYIEHGEVRLKPDPTGSLQARPPQPRPTGSDRVEKLSVMNNKEATEYLLQFLND